MLEILTTTFIVIIECVKIDRNNNIIVIIMINAFTINVRKKKLHAELKYYNKHLPKTTDVCTDEILRNQLVQQYTRSPVIEVCENLLCYVVLARIYTCNILLFLMR